MVQSSRSGRGLDRSRKAVTFSAVAIGAAQKFKEFKQVQNGRYISSYAPLGESSGVDGSGRGCFN